MKPEKPQIISRNRGPKVVVEYEKLGLSEVIDRDLYYELTKLGNESLLKDHIDALKLKLTSE